MASSLGLQFNACTLSYYSSLINQVASALPPVQSYCSSKYPVTPVTITTTSTGDVLFSTETSFVTITPTADITTTIVVPTTVIGDPSTTTVETDTVTITSQSTFYSTITTGTTVTVCPATNLPVKFKRDTPSCSLKVITTTYPIKTISIPAPPPTSYPVNKPSSLTSTTKKCSSSTTSVAEQSSATTSTKKCSSSVTSVGTKLPSGISSAMYPVIKYSNSTSSTASLVTKTPSSTFSSITLAANSSSSTSSTISPSSTSSSLVPTPTPTELQYDATFCSCIEVAPTSTVVVTTIPQSTTTTVSTVTADSVTSIVQIITTTTAITTPIVPVTATETNTVVIRVTSVTTTTAVATVTAGAGGIYQDNMPTGGGCGCSLAVYCAYGADSMTVERTVSAADYQACVVACDSQSNCYYAVFNGDTNTCSISTSYYGEAVNRASSVLIIKNNPGSCANQGASTCTNQ